MSQQHDDTTRIETLLDGPARSSEGSSAPRPEDRTEGRTEDLGHHPDEPAEHPDPSSAPPITSSAPSASDASSAPDAPGWSGSPASAPQYAPYRGQAAVPEYKSGPAPTTSVIGLLGLLTVIAVLVAQATDLDIPWGVVGPVAVVGAGVLLVVLGLAGLRGQRYRG